jgi:hypothetical protein
MDNKRIHQQTKIEKNNFTFQVWLGEFEFGQLLPHLLKTKRGGVKGGQKHQYEIGGARALVIKQKTKNNNIMT